MNLTFLLIGFALAVFMGSALVSLLLTIRPEWTARRRRLIAASVLPAITAIATIGGGFTLVAWIGGLVGATLTSRRRDR
jgi:MFS family permease